MRDHDIIEVRNYEIREVYFIVYKRAMKQGVSPKDAKTEAYSAIELRYCISRESARRIVNTPAKRESARLMGLFRERTEQLMELLREVRDETCKRTG